MLRKMNINVRDVQKMHDTILLEKIYKKIHKKSERNKTHTVIPTPSDYVIKELETKYTVVKHSNGNYIMIKWVEDTDGFVKEQIDIIEKLIKRNLHHTKVLYTIPISVNNFRKFDENINLLKETIMKHGFNVVICDKNKLCISWSQQGIAQTKVKEEPEPEPEPEIQVPLETPVNYDNDSFLQLPISTRQGVGNKLLLNRFKAELKKYKLNADGTPIKTIIPKKYNKLYGEADKLLSDIHETAWKC